MCVYRNPATDTITHKILRETSIVDEVELGYRVTNCLGYENNFDLDNWLAIVKGWLPQWVWEGAV